MKKLEISAYTIEDAKIEAFKQGITVMYDITSYWKSCGSPLIGVELNICVGDFVNKKGLMEFEGAGVIIQADKGKFTSRARPYILEKFKRGHRCKTKKAVEVRRMDTDEVVGVGKTKLDALYKAQDIIKDLKTDLYGKLVYYSPVDDYLFKLTYMPSPKTHLGTYIIFGIEKDDVIRYKQQLRNL